MRTSDLQEGLKPLSRKGDLQEGLKPPFFTGSCSGLFQVDTQKRELFFVLKQCSKIDNSVKKHLVDLDKLKFNLLKR